MALILASLPIAASSLRAAHDVAPQWDADARTPGTVEDVRVSFQRPDGRRLSVTLRPQTTLTTDALRRTLRQAPNAHTFTGRILGIEDSWARLTLIEGAWMGVIRTPTDLWLLEPARQHADWQQSLDLDSSATLIYTLADLATPLSYGADAIVPAIASPSVFLARDTTAEALT